MNIAEEVIFDKEGDVVRFPLIRKLFLALVIILTAGLSFGLGRLTGAGKSEPIRIEYGASLGNAPATTAATPSQQASVISATAGNTGTEVVASKSGSKYHYPYCAGAKQIKEANKITFPTPEAAESAGYTLAANCSPK